MLYIHQPYCISPQQTFQNINIEQLNEPADKKLLAIEPAYEGIPPGILRRMGKAIRIGVGAAMPIIKNSAPLNGIIIGTANGGMGDCILFLNQIVQYEEGLLAPGNFVQSTSNAIAAQLGLLSNNKSYNITHVHRGLAFENAVIDAMMQLAAFPEQQYLLGGVEEISSYNYNIQNLTGAYKKEVISNSNLYETDSPGSIAGEGAAAFLVNNKKENAVARLEGISILHSEDEQLVKEQMQVFIAKYLPAGQTVDLFLSGENGDNRSLHFYTTCESLLADDTAVARFKHMCGEYPTASAVGLWYACQLLQTQSVPQHMFKKKTVKTTYQNILMYNNFKGGQHSFILVSK
ncbi:MAG: beta-ketoacyl synthase chain length factor [Ferruginibacter sp.]